MADIGLYNYVKGALARGESREFITQDLLKGGTPQATIEEVFTAVESGVAPQPMQTMPGSVPSRSIHQVPADVSDLARQQQHSWESFSGSFWKYAGVLILVWVFEWLLALAHIGIGIFGLVFTVIDLIVLISIVMLVGEMTREIRGSRSVLMMVLAFFIPFFAYYLTYYSAKKKGWSIRLPVIETIIVFVLGVYYLLRIILYVLLVGGLVLAISLAGGHIGVPSTYVNGTAVSGSALQQQQAHNNEQIKESLEVIGTFAHTYYDENGETYGPFQATSTACAGGAFADPQIAGYLGDLRTRQNATVECGISPDGKFFDVQAMSAAGNWCINSSGTATSTLPC